MPTVVFTGRLSVRRSAAVRMALDAGCCVGKNVTRRTTLVVVGKLRRPSRKLLDAQRRCLAVLSEREFLERIGEAVQLFFTD